MERSALIQTLASTLDDVQEPQVAEKKIHWWHEELQRQYEGNARHPATVLCQSTLADSQSAMTACLEVVSAMATQRFTPPETQAACDENLVQSYQARLALLAHALTTDDSDLGLTSHPVDAALALAKHDQLVQLPRLIHRGLPVFPTEQYQRFNIQPTDLAKHIRQSNNATPDTADPSASTSSQPTSLKSIPIVTDNPGRKQLLEEAVEHAHNALTQALNDPEVKRRYRRGQLMPLWRLLVLRERAVRLWRRTHPDLLRERTTLTPLAKLYHAWRNRK